MPVEPRVSVCIRAHTREDGLRSAIRSVLTQTYGDFEVVVSDDSGRLADVAGAFGDPRVRYHHNTRRGGPAANLANAVSLARAQLIAILNDDDFWLPGFLAATVGVFDRHSEVGVVFSDDFFEIGTRRVRRRLPFAPGRHDRFLPELLEYSMPASAVVMRRAVWEEGERAVPVSPRMVGDAVVWLRSAAAGWPFYYLDQPLAVSRVHSRQISWSDERLPTLLVAAFDAFRFDDPVAERLRRARVAEFLLARAHVHLMRRRFLDAWRDMARAHRTAPRPLGVRAALALSGMRGVAIRRGASYPLVLVALLKLWGRVRPPVSPDTPLVRRADDNATRTRGDKMKYALLIYDAPGTYDALSDEDRESVFGEYFAISEAPGVFGGDQLQPAETATTVRVEGGDTLTTDGPFADTKEVFGGYYLLEADDVDKAIELAARIPAARLGGSVEVRPIVER